MRIKRKLIVCLKKDTTTNMKKNILLIIFTFLSFLVFTQKNTTDTSQMCIPYPIAKQILLDLNNYDKLQEIVKTYKEEIYELNKKTQVLQKENEAWEKEDSLSKEIIKEKGTPLLIHAHPNYSTVLR